jgi:hypothetical protein
MKTILALAALVGAIVTSGTMSFGAVDTENEDFILEASLDPSSQGDKRWRGHVQRIVETVDGKIVRERFFARAAFTTRSVDIGTYKSLAKQGVILRLANADGVYAQCHLPQKHFDVDLEDWELVTSAAFSISFDARMKRSQWIIKKGKKEALCDINPGAPDAHLGIPEIQPGDLVEVSELSAKVLEGEVRLQAD